MTPKTKRIVNRASVDMKLKLLRAWSLSRLNVDEFAQRNGVGKSTLYKWRRRFEDTEANDSKQPTFIPVKIKDRQTRPAEIHTANSMLIRVYEDTDEASLVRALRAVIRCG